MPGPSTPAACKTWAEARLFSTFVTPSTRSFSTSLMPNIRPLISITCAIVVISLAFAGMVGLMKIIRGGVVSVTPVGAGEGDVGVEAGGAGGGGRETA